jgi:hypothetical protein
MASPASFSRLRMRQEVRGLKRHLSQRIDLAGFRWGHHRPLWKKSSATRLSRVVGSSGRSGRRGTAATRPRDGRVALDLFGIAAGLPGRKHCCALGRQGRVQLDYPGRVGATGGRAGAARQRHASPGWSTCSRPLRHRGGAAGSKALRAWAVKSSATRLSRGGFGDCWSGFVDEPLES